MRGHIHKRVSTDRSGRTKALWYVVIDLGRDANGKRRQKWHGSYPTRKAAEAARAEIVAEYHRGTYVEPSKVTLAEWVRDTWLPSMRAQVKPSTWDSYSRNLELHVLPRLGHRPLRELTAALLNAAYSELLESGHCKSKGGLSPKTVRYLHTTLHKALADAVDAGLLGTNPAERARPPKPAKAGPTELRFWTPDQLRTFLASIAGTRLEAAWHLAAMTGMRRGEVLGLRWADVDLDAARLTVRHTIISVAYEVRESTPKTHQARVIDLDPETIRQLRCHHDRQQAERDRWGDDYQGNDLVFCRENGTPLHPDTFSQSFERAIAKTDLPRIRLHDLRHTHATIALRAGVPVKVISERLGHESPAFTMKQYAHALPGMQAEAAALIASLVRGDEDEDASHNP
ncbi:MAG: site-specific integrase [Acidimicrobiia bacterium]|nr:site-specific integrase [Acidimicrobiia bacterium]